VLHEAIETLASAGCMLTPLSRNAVMLLLAAFGCDLGALYTVRFIMADLSSTATQKRGELTTSPIFVARAAVYMLFDCASDLLQTTAALYILRASLLNGTGRPALVLIFQAMVSFLELGKTGFELGVMSMKFLVDLHLAAAAPKEHIVVDSMPVFERTIAAHHFAWWVITVASYFASISGIMSPNIGFIVTLAAAATLATNSLLSALIFTFTRDCGHCCDKVGSPLLGWVPAGAFGDRSILKKYVEFHLAAADADAESGTVI
jgi:hypothetical protein